MDLDKLTKDIDAFTAKLQASVAVTPSKKPIGENKAKPQAKHEPTDAEQKVIAAVSDSKEMAKAMAEFTQEDIAEVIGAVVAKTTTKGDKPVTDPKATNDEAIVQYVKVAMTMTGDGLKIMEMVLLHFPLLKKSKHLADLIADTIENAQKPTPLVEELKFDSTKMVLSIPANCEQSVEIMFPKDGIMFMGTSANIMGASLPLALVISKGGEALFVSHLASAIGETITNTSNFPFPLPLHSTVTVINPGDTAVKMSLALILAGDEIIIPKVKILAAKPIGQLPPEKEPPTDKQMEDMVRHQAGEALFCEQLCDIINMWVDAEKVKEPPKQIFLDWQGKGYVAHAPLTYLANGALLEGKKTVPPEPKKPETPGELLAMISTEMQKVQTTNPTPTDWNHMWAESTKLDKLNEKLDKLGVEGWKHHAIFLEKVFEGLFQSLPTLFPALNPGTPGVSMAQPIPLVPLPASPAGLSSSLEIANKLKQVVYYTIEGNNHQYKYSKGILMAFDKSWKGDADQKLLDLTLADPAVTSKVQCHFINGEVVPLNAIVNGTHKQV